uniref:Uncharacterized protein n=1 Tax=Romanomermis culicivorax TaxID=13658 RepID=A0A915J5H1_ROMCU
HGQRLTASDLDRLKIFVQEFCCHSFLPLVERQLRLLNDQKIWRIIENLAEIWGKGGEDFSAKHATRK